MLRWAIGLETETSSVPSISLRCTKRAFERIALEPAGHGGLQRLRSSPGSSPPGWAVVSVTRTMRSPSRDAPSASGNVPGPIRRARRQLDMAKSRSVRRDELVKPRQWLGFLVAGSVQPALEECVTPEALSPTAADPS
jgi:hypothetical protein